MKFEFSEPIPLVQQKKKHSPFKITPIGGADEIGKWREMQEAKEHVYRMRLKSRTDRLLQFEAEIGEKLASPKLSKASWAEQLAFAASERNRLVQAEKRAEEYPTWTRVIEPKKTLIERIARFFKNLWINSNF